jgi:hypothetical protein
MIIELNVFMESNTSSVARDAFPIESSSVVIDMMIFTVDVEQERNKYSQNVRCFIFMPSTK